MSMPEFPTVDPCLTKEQALNMILSSIAMEELALSHIINAEGEKLQCVLANSKLGSSCLNTSDVLAANKSVTSLMEVIMQTQILLKSKMEKVLEAMPRPTPDPCPPPCPDQECTACCPCRTVAMFETMCYRWDPMKALPFVQTCCSDILLDDCDNTWIVLPCKKRLALAFDVRLDSCLPPATSIKIQKNHPKIIAAPQVFQTNCDTQSISGGSIITTFCCDKPSKISLCLLSRQNIIVKFAKVRVVEI